VQALLLANPISCSHDVWMIEGRQYSDLVLGLHSTHDDRYADAHGIISPLKRAQCWAYLQILLVADLCAVHDLDHYVQAILLRKPFKLLTTGLIKQQLHSFVVEFLAHTLRRLARYALPNAPSPSSSWMSY